MTSATRGGFLVAIAHIALIASLGGKLLADRARYPRVWVEATSVDPMLPVRGRYVSLRIDAATGPDLTLPPAGPATSVNGHTLVPAAPAVRVRLRVEHGSLVAHPAGTGTGQLARAHQSGGEPVAELVEPLAFFIPATVADPSRRPAGETLWVEVTIPPEGPPRPIQLGVTRLGVLTPLTLN